LDAVKVIQSVTSHTSAIPKGSSLEVFGEPGLTGIIIRKIGRLSNRLEIHQNTADYSYIVDVLVSIRDQNVNGVRIIDCVLMNF